MYAGSIAARIDEWLLWHDGHEAPSVHAVEEWARFKEVARTLAEGLKRNTLTTHSARLTHAGVSVIQSLHRSAAHIVETAPQAQVRGRKRAYNRYSRATDELLRNFAVDAGTHQHIGTVTENLIRVMRSL